MSAPTAVGGPDFSDTPHRFAVLPTPDGDFLLLYRNRVTNLYDVVIPTIGKSVDPSFEDQVIPLAPIELDVPDDLIARFKQQLDGGTGG